MPRGVLGVMGFQYTLESTNAVWVESSFSLIVVACVNGVNIIDRQPVSTKPTHITRVWLRDSRFICMIKSSLAGSPVMQRRKDSDITVV